MSPSEVEQAPVAHVSVDQDGCVIAWNHAANDTFGWSGREALGRDLGELLLNPRRAALHRQHIDAFRTTGVSDILGRHSNVPMSTRDGRLLRVDCLVWSAVDDRGRSALHTLMSDVSDRYAAELASSRANADLNAFSAVMAHELRVPLTTIKGYAELLRDSLGPVEPVARIDRAVERGVALIDDVLRYLSVGRVLAIREPVDLQGLVQQVADEQQSAASRYAEIDIRSLPEMHGDSRLLALLFGNLIGNALKYCPTDRSVHVIIDAVDDVDPVWGATLRVQDNGNPIPIDDRARIFEMFERGSTFSVPGGDVPGSGVGLAVSQRIAALHGGEITLEDGAESGNRFVVRLGP